MKKIKPRAGQESVWDYPRPPVLEHCTKHIRILFHREIIVDTNRSYRLLETSHPPTYYLPMDEFSADLLVQSEKRSHCEFKGVATYFHMKIGDEMVLNAAWGYEDPMSPFANLRNHISVYAHLVDACYVGDELVKAQEGDFYGGWITSNVVGPFKGGPDTLGW